MDQSRRLRRLCTVALLWAVVFRLCIAGIPDRLLSRITQSDMVSFLIYLETGRIVRFSSSEGASSGFFRESAPPALPEEKVVFSAEDGAAVEIARLCNRQPDVQALIAQPLSWNLRDGESAVLILHTHTTESYTKAGEDYAETSPFRTLEEAYNMLNIGDAVAARLEQQGIAVIHDRTVHDYPSYNGSYAHARKRIQQLLEENPDIRLVLDLHRDASGSQDRQLRTETEAAGQTCAQLMLVMGTDAGGLTHPDWEENLSLALKLHVQLERMVPGIMRPVSLRAQRFNQDLHPGALLVEVGAAGNTRQEALLAGQYLADAIAALAEGTG